MEFLACFQFQQHDDENGLQDWRCALPLSTVDQSCCNHRLIVENTIAKAMPSAVDFPLPAVQHLLASPARLSGPMLYLALSSALVFAVWQLLFARPCASKNAPKAWNVHDWPIVGSALSFYSRRRDMVLEGLAASQHGNFSFFVGKKHVVAVSGSEGRKMFYESRALNFSAG